MEKEPLLPYSSPPPEESEITIVYPSSSLSKPQVSTTSELPSMRTLDYDSERLNLDQERSNLYLENQQSWLISPNYPASNINLHRSKSAPSIDTSMDEVDRFIENKPPQYFGKPSIIRQCVMLLILYLILGVVIYSFNEDSFRGTQTHPVVDGLYFSIITMCTIGYADITPDSAASKLLSIALLLVGFGFIHILLTGMVNYVLKLQQSSFSRTTKNGTMKVALALGVVVLCIAVGVIFMHFFERRNWLDSFYLSVMSVTTVGYGERVFDSAYGRIFASIWLLLSVLSVARALLYLAEARVDKSHRQIANRVLSQDMTIAQFLDADIDHDGFVSKSEYVIHKLKEMGKVSEKEILLICKHFERLDGRNCGKITLADVMEGHK